jgi:hypothetical protein
MAKMDWAVLGRTRIGEDAPAPAPAPEPACGACNGAGRISVHHVDTGIDETRACFQCGGQR